MTLRFWTTFPRKIAFPNKFVCKDVNEFISYYNRYNGISNRIYVGIYGCEEDGSQINVDLNVVGFDIDDIDKPEQYANMMKLHNHLLALNWEHSVMFSTKGAWIFVSCIPRNYPREMAKGKLAAMQDKIIEGTGLTFGDAHTFPLDKAIRGDVERITRMPTSYDKGRERYCLFLTEEDLAKGYTGIVELSKKPSKTRLQMIPIFGNKVELDPDKLQMARVSSGIVEMSEFEYKYEIPITTEEQHRIIIESLPDCVKSWIMDPEMATWQGRAYATLFLREKGFPLAYVKGLLKPFYEKHPRTDDLRNNWEHYEKVRAGELVYSRRDLKFPNCQTLWEEGLCRGKCKDCPGAKKSPAYR